ncbi:Uma2 family endonuclease [Nocardiopsis xinjiangensis]|uniref:Uma2 family endonuclease n=1 Tax=Nocardiopsis xinjiangensis TaxID=124285 RepID=UPI00035F066F
MTTGDAGTPERPLTVGDLEHTPEDGRRYELVDGRLDVSPAPGSLHMRVANRLATHLNIVCGGEYEIGENAGINLDSARINHRIPDVVVFDGAPPMDGYTDVPPLLVVEIISPDSIFRDSSTKRGEYAAFGVPSYWIINPLADRIGLLELRLDRGGYRDAAQVHGDTLFGTDAPFPVSLVPHWLTADGPWLRHLGGD